VSALHIQKNRYWLLVKVLCPNRHKTAHFADALPSPSLNKYSENKIKTRRTHTPHNRFAVLFRDYPGEPVPKENLLLAFCGAREADTPTIRLGATSSGLISNPPPTSPIFYAGCPSCRNPPNLSWLGTGTKYAGLHMQWHG